MRGHNRGELPPGINPTEQEVTVEGASAFALVEQGIRSVRAYVDQKTLVERAGLTTIVQPIWQGQAKEGYSMRVASG